MIWLFIGLGYGIQNHRIYVIGYDGLHPHKQISGGATSLAQATPTQAESGSRLCARWYGQAKAVAQDVSHHHFGSLYEIPYTDSMFGGEIWTLSGPFGIGMYPLGDLQIKPAWSYARILHSVPVVDAGWNIDLNDLRALRCAHTDSFSRGLCHIL